MDVGFASVPVFSPGLQVTELFEDELFLIVGRSHRLAREVSVKVEEIARERIILFERGASLRRATDRFFNQIGLAPTFVLESNDTLFVKLMVEHGIGISLLPPWAVRDEVISGKLTKLRIEGYNLTRSIAMVSLGQFQPSSVRAFVAYILDHKPELQALAKGEPV